MPGSVTVPSTLSGNAASIWRSAFLAAYKEHKGSDEIAAKIAWSAVKNKYKKNEKGEWVTKEADKSPTTEHEVVEVFDLSEGTTFSVDEATGKMGAKITIIKAGTSKNNRHYPPEVLENAVNQGHFNGIRMFIDHGGPPQKRSMKDLVSAIGEAYWDAENQKVTGDVDFFNKEFFEYAQRATNYIGTSISAQVRGYRQKEASKVIEKVTGFERVHSTDWVIYPAAGGGVDQFVFEGEQDVDWENLTLEELEKNAPGLVEQLTAKIKESLKPADDEKDTTSFTKEEVEALIETKVKTIRESYDAEQAKKAEAQTKYREFITKAGVPAKTQERLIRQFSDGTEFVEESAKAAVEEAKAELKEAGAGPHITDMGTTGSTDGEKSPRVVTAKDAVESYFKTGQSNKEEAKK